MSDLADDLGAAGARAGGSFGLAQGEVVFQGFPVSPGIAIERAFVLDAEEFRIAERFVEPHEVEGAVERFERALEQARGEVCELQQRCHDALGAETAQIFKFHELMLSDLTLHDEILKRIRVTRFSPEYAVSRAFLTKIQAIRSVGDEYLRQRDIDVIDVKRRVLRGLFGERRRDVESLEGEFVLVAHDLTPSQTASLDTRKFVGFAIDAGGRTSHTAILARALGIPAVVGLGDITSCVAGGDQVVIDGTKGKVIVNPSEETLRVYQGRRQQFVEFTRDLAELRTLPAETLDGHKITILANIEFPEEVQSALENGAEGIGLYRTEFLYTEGRPDERRHFQAYRKAVEDLDGRPLVVRSLDLGADKFADTINQREPNPFLGCRSIRYCFQHPEEFKTQLRALLRATAYGPIKLMLPMITSLDEVRRAKLILQSVMEDLERENVPFDDKIPVGIMVEVPSAALIADVLAKEVAFLSIGTNDLIQYTLAVDRMNERVADLYQPAHPAVLRLIRMVIDAGHRSGIEVSMCGEMSGDVAYTIPLLGLGLRTFSISPGSVPEIKKVTRSITLRESVDVVERVFAFSEAQKTESYLRTRARRIVPQLF
jgi:phosphoenolpyruvate-protein phosphotransferase (PTS system enzyme I)